MSYNLLPELVAVLWMAVVLARLRSREPGDQIHLWIFGLVLFVVEGLARFFYLMPTSPGLHSLFHVIALDAYFLAGVAFFQSATGKLRQLRYGDVYLFICAVPHLALLTMYGSNLHDRAAFLVVAAVGFSASVIAAAFLKRPLFYWLCNAVIWLPILIAAAKGDFRLLAYTSLFFAYLAAAIAFLLTLPSEFRGRAVVVTGFCVWSLCFITHPWIAEHRTQWLLLAEKIWDLQKFFVMFGLLIVSLEEQSSRNEYQALHDILTGLPNRRLFEDRLDQSLARAQRNRTRLVLFNMDLDDFKQVNDTFGHNVGDDLLREVGRRLLSVKRETDTLARMGGDEFYLLINDFNAEAGPRSAAGYSARREVHSSEGAGKLPLATLREQASHLAEVFRQAVEREPCLLTVEGSTQAVMCRLSIGSVVFPDEANERTLLCRIADEKMYANKKLRAGSKVEVVLDENPAQQVFS